MQTRCYLRPQSFNYSLDYFNNRLTVAAQVQCMETAAALEPDAKWRHKAWRRESNLLRQITIRPTVLLTSRSIEWMGREWDVAFSISS